MYGTEAVAYVAVYIVQLGKPGAGPGSAGAFGGALNFAWTLITHTFIPGMLGGPWRWLASGDYAVANPPVPLDWIAVAVAAVIILISVSLRLRAWRAWAILLGWLLIVDVLPVLAGRGGLFSSGILGMETRYVMETTGLTALVAGLAFLPVRRQAVTGAKQASSGLQKLAGRAASLAAGRVVTGGLVGIVTLMLIGSIWSFHAYLADTTSESGRSFLATARLALAEAPVGTVVVSAPVPANVLGGYFPVSAGDSAQVLMPLIRHGNEPSFVSAPDGTFDSLMEFDGWGRLAPAGIVGTVSQPLRGPRSCWPVTDGYMRVRLNGVPANVEEIRIGYTAVSAGVIYVTYAGQTRSIAVSSGSNSAYAPFTGHGNTILIAGMSSSQLCVSDAQAGFLWPSSTGSTIPAASVMG
jgi:hypothetical protein